MKITHLGARDCVTGSCHLIEFRPDSSQQLNILVDCGSAYGDDPELPFAQFPVAPGEIDYLFLTHAHIDHIGRVPELIEAGFAGEIICTHATRALLLPMLRDAISFSDRAGGKGRKRDDDNHEQDSGRNGDALLARIDELAWGFELHEIFRLRYGVTFKLFNAGHILGSCFILFSFPRAGESPYRVIFSGDLGCSNTPILPDPDPPEQCDLLVLESTYGDRRHPDRANRIAKLEKILTKALADNGIVYIPAFALGRTQELLYELDLLNIRVPVFVDSPLGLEITKIYSGLEQYWDKEARSRKASGDHPFDFKGLYAVERYRDHKKLLTMQGQAIIIAGSGMCTGGRIVDHLEQGVDDPQNDILFIGYQAQGTPGRKMIDGHIPMKAGIHILNGYSAHADRQMLVEWVRSMPEPPGEIRLVHGEEGARKSLQEMLG